MNELLDNLVRLQSLELGEVKEKNSESTIDELRAKIPPQILGHYDRLMARGKKGIVAVQNQVCTGCHMRLPIGVITTLMHRSDLQLCDSCGRYLYLAETTEPKETPVAAEPAPKKKTRKRKATLQAV
jgi:predicted  nucleic acid-binding Zn-ribbon protein